MTDVEMKGSSLTSTKIESKVQPYEGKDDYADEMYI